MSEGFTARGRLRMAAGLVAALANAACGGGGGSGGGSPPPPPPQLPPPPPPPTTALKTAYNGKFLTGAAFSSGQTTDTTLTPVLNTHFNSMTAEWEMKADVMGPSEGVYNFAPGDTLATYCANNGISLRGHTLLWHQTSPAWFFAGGNATVIRNRLETYIHDVVTHFAGKVYAWDVVNEVASDGANPVYREDSPWHQALGPDYIEYAFRAARAADPNVKLFYNDYSSENAGKRTRILAIIDDLIAKGVPIDGFGHQCHINIGASAANIEAALVAIETRHLINHVTELDIDVYTSGSAPDYGVNVPASVLHDQAVLYRQIYQMLATHTSVQSVTTWGVYDGSSWLNTWPVTRTNYPLLFDRAKQPKTALYAVVDPTYAIP
ncbi:MAG TPA: endo-1,4-beta-xylanase [Caulobacterales bacterium]|nr:endo-1,4-beta-xylanase [Caulobacterales bacterium]